MKTNYTAQHGSPGRSVAKCDECGSEFIPRIKHGPNADRFCHSSCKDRYWNRKRQSPPVREHEAGLGETNVAVQLHANSITPIPKWKRVLAEFARGHSLNRFEAERHLHDHCLNSTVSRIQAQGISVSRKNETVPGFQGAATRVCRYWLESEEREKAALLLGWTNERHSTV